ncbi:hypothetical protein GCM10010401_04170 [Rarobacter faecitabidus]|uniref:Protein-disulfide isomerase n=1 Tax=Rarobacter faecitabidus TaxID=13243 RepID=A0A542ZU33_RARFA|nr:thioredoxin domain-containing protein [Rarobacter faecitabidus]TQL63827.1 protein-disulfide isomerase [Rarobacter faecitabidus]
MLHDDRPAAQSDNQPAGASHPNPAQQAAAPPRRGRYLFITGVAVAVFAAVVIAGQLTNNNTQQPPSATPPAAETSAAGGEGTTEDSSNQSVDPEADQVAPATGQEGIDHARHDPDDTMAIGDIDAPVTVVEWTDLRCSYCAAFMNDTFEALKTHYIDTGLVRWEFYDVAYFGDDSTQGAIAARAAARQNSFEDFLRTAYAAAPERGLPDLPRDKLLQFAADAGVPDLDLFEQDLDNPDLIQQVKESTYYARVNAVAGVPFFNIDGTVIGGAQSLETFTKAIDEKLAAAGR